MATTETHTGGCLCGAVRYEATAAPAWVAHCHCPSCRRNTGAAMATFAGFDRGRFRWAGGGPPARYHSSPGVTRSFCARCGTPLSYEADRYPGEIHLLVGTLDRPEAAAPTMHVWTAHRLPWLHLADALPSYSGESDQPEN